MRDIVTSEYGVTYDGLIDSMEVERLVEVSDDDYHGSTRILVRDGERYGVIEFGWGSCSGCDALQAIDDGGRYDEASGRFVYSVQTGHVELRDDIWNGIHWEPDAPSMLTWLRERDWDLQWGTGGPFAQQAIAHLGAVPS